MAKFSPQTKYEIVNDTIKIKDFYDYAEEYVTRPPYQRKTVWNRKKQQALLDSLFRRYYVPRIVIREVRLSEDHTVSEVIDGQQRITTVQNFFAGRLSLPESLADIHPDLPGATYATLSSSIRRFVDRLAYSADIVKGIEETHDPEHQKIATEIFWRLQQGESLNYMEVAHSRLSSLVRNFVVKYADDQRFDYQNYAPVDYNPDKHPFFTVISRNNNRMQHLGLLTRMLLIERDGGYADLKNADVSTFVDENQVENGIANWSLENESFAKATLKNMSAFYRVFRSDPMVTAGNGMGEFRDEYFIISTYILLRHLCHYYVFDKAEERLFHDFILDFHERLRGSRRNAARDLLIFSDNRQQSRAEIQVRDRIMRQSFFEYLSSKGQSFVAKDSRRAFNESERISIYRRDKGLCQLCLEEGKPEKEALVPWSEYQADHVVPHARGGQTDIANAQVLCAYHNQRKGAASP